MIYLPSREGIASRTIMEQKRVKTKIIFFQKFSFCQDIVCFVWLCTVCGTVCGTLASFCFRFGLLCRIEVEGWSKINLQSNDGVWTVHIFINHYIIEIFYESKFLKIFVRISVLFYSFLTLISALGANLLAPTRALYVLMCHNNQTQIVQLFIGA